MSKVQKGNRENKKPKADKNQLMSMYRPTRRRKVRVSRPLARSRKSPDARFGLKQTAYSNSLAGVCTENLMHIDQPNESPNVSAS